MRIRNRITLLFTVLTASLLLIFATTVYLSSKKNRESEYYNVLKNEAITKANLLFKVGVDAHILQDIYHHNREVLDELEMAVYDTSFHLLYHDAESIDIVKETRQLNDRILKEKEIYFYEDDWQVVGLVYLHNDQQYVITAASYDRYGINKTKNLLHTLVFSFCIFIFVIYVVGLYISKKAFDPVKDITDSAHKISASNLDMRLQVHNSKDELSEMSDTFNAMLDRLEKSFDAQKEFVYNISHELRTPLAAIIAELELTNSKERSIGQYQDAIDNALTDSRKLTQLINNLLDLAKANYDTSEIHYKPIRIDEILLDARQIVQRTHPNYKIDINFDREIEDENEITVHGNEYLLRLSFINLFDNGCKFSNNSKCRVMVYFDKAQVILKFSDEGIGISERDLGKIFNQFFRGNNSNYTDGTGIGLSLTQKIIHLHKGDIQVYSQENIGSTFTVSLPHNL